MRPLAAWLARPVLSEDVRETSHLLLVSRALRGFCDGLISVLLPVYLLGLGLTLVDVGLISTATLAGSAVATILVGALAHRVIPRTMFVWAGALMALTGIGFGSLSSLWPLLCIAFVGTLNPGGGDVSLFLPLEQSRLADVSTQNSRTALFARYNLVGSLSIACGALAAGIPAWLSARSGTSELALMRCVFWLYAVIGLVVTCLYLRLPKTEGRALTLPQPLSQSRRIVIRLALLFSVDAFAGGLLVNAMLALWLVQRFEVSAGFAGQLFFGMGVLSAISQLAAVPLARKFGLINTMVWTHIPSSLCLIAAAFSTSQSLALVLLLVRSALSQMDVPTRTAYVMAVVTPSERQAAASFTAVPRSLAAAIAPTLAGGLIGFGWLSAPLVACGALKIAYDLSLLLCFREVRPED